MIFNLIRQHRGIHNQLGFAVQLCYLRFPGRTLSVPNLAFPLRHGWNTLNGRCNWVKRFSIHTFRPSSY
jgi:Domain of unknown function (DUF4158)